VLYRHKQFFSGLISSDSDLDVTCWVPKKARVAETVPGLQPTGAASSSEMPPQSKATWERHGVVTGAVDSPLSSQRRSSRREK
jgi:hypothetical protein